MRNILKAAALVAMLTITGSAFAAQATPATAKKMAAPAKPAAVSNHTTSGTVKSATDSSLVVTKGGKDQTFVVNSATEKTGAVETGAKVNVHYTMSGKEMVATAITVAPAKSASKSKGK
jgi:type II secretory pathway component PulC